MAEFTGIKGKLKADLAGQIAAVLAISLVQVKIKNLIMLKIALIYAEML